MLKRLLILGGVLALAAGCDSPTEAPAPMELETAAAMHAPPAHAAPGVKLDLFRDCDVGGCGADNPLDMQGPGDQGWLIHRQDQETGDLLLNLKIAREGAPGETYRLYLTCGPGGVGTPHAESCGFLDVGEATANPAGNAHATVTVEKCAADALVSGNPYGDGQQAHLDVLRSAGDQGAGVFVATPIDFDPAVGPACAALSTFSADRSAADPTGAVR